jgi:hypothetical protein
MDNLEVHESADGLIVFQEIDDRVHHLNATASIIFELCDGTHDVAGIAAQVRDAFTLDHLPIGETTECLKMLIREGLVH